MGKVCNPVICTSNQSHIFIIPHCKYVLIIDLKTLLNQDIWLCLFQICRLLNFLSTKDCTSSLRVTIRFEYAEDEKVTEIKFHFAKCKRRSMRKKGWHFYYACSYSNKVCHKEHLLWKLTLLGLGLIQINAVSANLGPR